MARFHTTPDGNIPFTAEEEIEADSIAKLAEENEAKFGYINRRKVLYPDIGDQLDMIYKDNKNGTTTHADAVEAVKNKYPK